MQNRLQLATNAPWKARFRAPAIGWTQLAKAAPMHGLVATNRSGVYQLYAWDTPSGHLRPLTDRPEGRLFGYLSPDGAYVYYLDDQQGNEIGHFVRVPFAGGQPQDITPDLPPYSSGGITVSQAGNRLALNMATADGFHLYALDLCSTGAVGAPRLLYHSQQLVGGPLLACQGEVVILPTTAHTGQLQFSLLAIDPQSGERIGELWDGPTSSVEAIAFSPIAGDRRLLATTDHTGVKRPLLWNPRTNERLDLTLADITGEVTPLDWSPDGQRLLLCQCERAVQQLYIYDLTSQRLTQLNHPNGSFEAATFTAAGEIFANWQDTTHPPQLIALDSQSGVKMRTVLAAGEVPPGRPWQSVTFSSSDGQRIQGWLALPGSRSEGPFPTILDTHGGPTAAMTECFSPDSQTWLDHGFAFLTINYRGSTTFGREFERKIWGNPGHWEVEDMVAAHAWLVGEGIAKPDQILLTGWSYGGFLTLQALGQRPDLWAGGMAVIAIADWIASYEDSADTLRGYQVALFGGTPQEKRAQYIASSPITYAEAVRAPVLIIQGRHDSRTPARPVALYEAKMKALGKPIEVHWFEAGHFGAGVELEITRQELMLRFAYRMLGLVVDEK